MSASERPKIASSLACERCRAQKLRCNWPPTAGSNAPCERCSRKGVECRKNQSRRVGRPPKVQTERARSASIHVVDPHGISLTSPVLWREACDGRDVWEDSQIGVTPIDPAMIACGLESPLLLEALTHSGELTNLIPSGSSTDWMIWSSAGSNSINLISEQSTSEESIVSSSDNSEATSRYQEALAEDQPDTAGRESSDNASLTCEVASLISCLFELGPPDATCQAETSSSVSGAGPSARPATNIRSILQNTQKLSDLVARIPGQTRILGSENDSTRRGLAPMGLDGPTKLLLLSSYVKIFQTFRQTFAAIYSSIKRAENITELLYELRVGDVILDGDNDLKVLVLMQVVTHKLNTLGVQLGIPEKHLMSLDLRSAPEVAEQVPNCARQQPEGSEGTEPTLDTILSGSDAERCVFWGELECENRRMESAAAAFREELGLLRGQLGHRDRCR